MEHKTIIFQVEDALATLTFNRPKALNAISTELLKEFSYILDEIAANEAIRVLVLTGSGEKAFVAGADITELAELNALQAKNFSAQGQRAINKLQNLSIPVIAAVNGYALGGGTEIALASDFIYASANAVFGLPEITLGLIPGFGGTQRLTRLIGLNRAKEMIFTGKMIKADEAQTIGIVNKVCLPDQLWEEAIKIAKIISGKGAVALRAAKQVINNGVNADLTTGCQMETDAFALCMASEDAYEGTHAFLEKRAPEFKGNLFNK